MAEDGLKKTHFQKRHSSICSFRKQVTVLFVPFNQKRHSSICSDQNKVTVLFVFLELKCDSSICSTQ